MTIFEYFLMVIFPLRRGVIMDHYFCRVWMAQQMVSSIAYCFSKGRRARMVGRRSRSDDCPVQNRFVLLCFSITPLRYESIGQAASPLIMNEMSVHRFILPPLKLSILKSAFRGVQTCKVYPRLRELVLYSRRDSYTPAHFCS